MTTLVTEEAPTVIEPPNDGCTIGIADVGGSVAGISSPAVLNMGKSKSSTMELPGASATWRLNGYVSRGRDTGDNRRALAECIFIFFT